MTAPDAGGVGDYVRQLEDAVLILAAELPIVETTVLRQECPALSGFIAHLHHSIEHEQAMTRVNVWAETTAGRLMADVDHLDCTYEGCGVTRPHHHREDADRGEFLVWERDRCSKHDVVLVERFEERGTLMIPTGEFYCLHCAREVTSIDGPADG